MLTFDGNEAKADSLEMKTYVQQEMIKRGILWSGIHNICFSHTKADIDYTLKAYNEVLQLLRVAVQSGNIKNFLLGATLEKSYLEK